MPTDLESLQAYHWTPQPHAESLLRAIVDNFLQNFPQAAALANHMTADTGTRFFDWIDHLQLPAAAHDIQPFLAAGFVVETNIRSPINILHHPAAIFPKILLSPEPLTTISIKVDSAADYLAANQLDLPIEGDPHALIRRATIARHENLLLEIIERRGNPGFILPKTSPDQLLLAAIHHEQFRRRQRDFPNDAEGLHHIQTLINAAIQDLGPHQTAALFFAAEREYWQRRNTAAQVQKARQDRLGLGWANHDHHTYRSSRQYFKPLITLFESLGLHCRERFYAGREAGWGAQVMENPNANIVVFADVDLAPEELTADFAHQPLAPQAHLGTVGLWCALHGEAILQAGMHHLECQFDFDALKQQLESQHSVQVMKPFTHFPHLKQAFTQGERWPVNPARLAPLLAAHLITPEQAAQFQSQGAIGSHLENLERNAGYKGFNQTGVSQIIAATDPRRNLPLP